jgi:hypothetical protein
MNVKIEKYKNYTIEKYDGYQVLKPSYDDEYLSKNTIVISTYYFFTNVLRPEFVRDKISMFCKNNKRRIRYSI